MNLTNRGYRVKHALQSLACYVSITAAIFVGLLGLSYWNGL